MPQRKFTVKGYQNAIIALRQLKRSTIVFDMDCDIDEGYIHLSNTVCLISVKLNGEVFEAFSNLQVPFLKQLEVEMRDMSQSLHDKFFSNDTVWEIVVWQ